MVCMSESEKCICPAFRSTITVDALQLQGLKVMQPREFVDYFLQALNGVSIGVQTITSDLKGA